jgi:hypothetical protein
MRVIGHSSRKRTAFLYFLLVSVCVLYLAYKIAVAYSQSLFMRHGERVNIILYGQDATYYSLDTASGRHYVIYFFPDLKVQVPGGFGNYRIGSLGKLAHLEGEHAVIKRTLSVATASFVHTAFYPDGENVYYGTEVSKTAKRPYLPHFFSYRSEVEIFDRLYIILLLLGVEDTDFDLVDYREMKGRVHKADIFFQSDSFAKNSRGLLYETKYRNERKNVQIRYASEYQAAAVTSAILEGSGIRVSDILRMNNDKSRQACIVIEEDELFSETARDIASYFQCDLKTGKTDIYDTVFLLGKETEEDWYIAN